MKWAFHTMAALMKRVKKLAGKMDSELFIAF
jgi:hypothetical protein